MPKSRPSFTLMEMVLVLALLLVLAALTVPSLNDMYGGYKVQAAVDSVRACWAEARSQAVNEGRPYRFAVVKDRGNFRVAPDTSQYWSGAGRSDDAGGLVIENALPPGIRFTLGDTAMNGNAPRDSDTALPVHGISSDQWTGIVTFLPDGTAAGLDGNDSGEIRIIFQSRNAAPMLLKLRTLTGTVSARPYVADERGAR